LNLDVANRADPLEELQRGAVTAKKHVLPVVDELPGRAIREGRRSSAQLRPGVEHDRADPAFRQRRGGAEPRKPAPDHHNGV
jgi:hypothetical protein